MANQSCPCGSEQIPGTAPEIIIRLRDIQRGNFAIGNLFPLSHSPIFLALASDFCASSPRSNYAPPSGISSYLFNREINRVWAQRCRCKRALGTYRIVTKIISRTPNLPVKIRDHEKSTNIAGIVLNIRVAISRPQTNQVRIEIFGFTAANNYASEILIDYTQQGFLAPTDIFDFGGFSQSLISAGCPSSAPNPSTPSAPIPYPSIPRSPSPSRPPDFYLPELPPKKRVGLPPKPPEDECCDCC